MAEQLAQRVSDTPAKLSTNQWLLHLRWSVQAHRISDASGCDNTPCLPHAVCSSSSNWCTRREQPSPTTDEATCGNLGWAQVFVVGLSCACDWPPFVTRFISGTGGAPGYLRACHDRWYFPASFATLSLQQTKGRMLTIFLDSCYNIFQQS